VVEDVLSLRTIPLKLEGEIGAARRTKREAAAEAIQAKNTSDGSRVSVKTMEGKGVIERSLVVKLFSEWGKT
jgi:hypothetical protein